MTRDESSILLVDDSRLLTERLLELVGEMADMNAMAPVATESAAIEAVHSGRPDIVLLDLHLKEGTGFGVLRYINTLQGKRPAVIVLTNYALPQYRREAARLGARYFLDKSAEFERIPELIDQLRSEGCSGPR
jgi:two-component system, OmpR family, response regulator